MPPIVAAAVAGLACADHARFLYPLASASGRAQSGFPRSQPHVFTHSERRRATFHISDRHVPDVNTTGVVDIFVRRIFVRGNDNSFLPSWAKFVRGVIDSPDLQPTAARDNIQRQEHPVFEFLQKRLGELIIERLRFLAEKELAKFRAINRWHHYHLKGMAYYNDEFFDQVATLLLFDTNRGLMSLADYLSKNAPRPDAPLKAPLYYFAYHGAVGQFYGLANARDWVVIDAGRAFEEELLQKYAKRNPDTVRLERLDASDDPDLFERLNPEEEARFRSLELDIEGQLRRLGLTNVLVRMRRFSPAELPAVLIMTPESQAEEKLRDLMTQPWVVQAMEDVAQEAVEQTRRRPLYLSLNSQNPLIQQLVTADRRDPMVEDVLIGVYNSAFLYSGNLLTQRNTEVIHEQFVRMFQRLIAHQEKMQSLQRSLEQERKQLLELRQREVRSTAAHPDHILMFMIAPFADSYRPLEEAVRRVFERPPYCFEVKLARDHTYKSGLLDNVREHMLRAHGFIADISELNPNVMFELGAAMLAQETRPVFSLRSESARGEVPGDFKEKLYIPYGSLADPIGTLEAAIRAALERDGRPIHEGVQALIIQRADRFLSRTLLEALQIRLTADNIRQIMKNYATIESVLAAVAVDVQAATGLRDYMVTALQGELSEG